MNEGLIYLGVLFVVFLGIVGYWMACTRGGGQR